MTVKQATPGGHLSRADAHQNGHVAEDTIRLIVTPIDPDAPGSFALRRRMRRFIHETQTLDPEKDIVRILDIMDELESFVLDGCTTSDGSPVEDAIAQLSENEFQRLVTGRIGGGSPLSETTNGTGLPTG